jgi:acetyl/propionyl-CoA carboxylase alpha subunit
MVAKVIGVGEDRADAIDGLASALAAADIGGLVTNRDFLVAILRHPVFRDAPPTTKFLTEHDLEADDPLRAVDLVAATIALGAEGRPAEEAFGFRLNAPGRTSAHFLYDRKPVQVTVERDGRDAFAEIDGERHAFHLSTVGSAYTIAMNGETLDVEWGWSDGYAVFLLRDAGIIRVPLFNPFAEAGAGDADAAALSAPMPATVTNIMAKEGDSVTAGQPLVTVEAMKMETVIKAPHDGTVEAIHFAKGESAPKGALLVTLSAEG